MKKSVIYLIIIIQVILIGILINNIYTNKSIWKTISINPVPRDTIALAPSDTLEYFYEPKPNSITKPTVIFPGLERIENTINADTLNQTSDYPTEKKKGIFRIVTIGDSFTYGQHVNTKDNYPSQLENLLNTQLSCPTIEEFEVLNLGVGGYDFQYTVERFKRRGVKYNPDVVIWMIVSDNFSRIDELLIPRVNKLLKEAKKTGEYNSNIKKGIYYTYWTTARDDVVNQLGGEKGVMVLQKKYLEQYEKVHTGKLIMSILPPYKSSQENFIQTFTQTKANMTYFNGLPDIFSTSNTVLPDKHPSPLGHTLIAQAFTKYLVDEKFLPCTFK